MKLNHLITALIFVGLAILIGMLFFTSPIDIGPLGVLVFFTTVYVVAFGLTTKIMQLFYRLAFKRENFRVKDYMFAAVFAFAPSMFLMTRSFGSISVLNCLLIVLFVALVEFLVYKRAR